MIHRTARSISFVLPVFNEELNVPLVYEQIIAVVKTMGIPRSEVIFVDDGSKDKTIEVIKDLGQKDPNVKLLRLSTRVGHQVSCFAGIKAAQGDVVVSLDADLQHPPQVVAQLYAAWQKGADIVNTVREETQQQSKLRSLISDLFYRTLNHISNLNMVANTADFRLLDRGVVQELLTYEDRDIFLRGIVSQLQYPQMFVPYVAPARIHGVTKYNMKRMLKFAWSGIMNFSQLPLKLSIYASVLVFCFALIQTAYEFYEYFYGPKTPPGYMTLVLMMSIYASVILLVLGILGVYIGKIYQQTKGRPVYFVAEKINI